MSQLPTAVSIDSQVTNFQPTDYSKVEKPIEVPKENTVNISDELANFMFLSKYARYDENLKRRETWNESVARVENMHLNKFNHLDPQFKEKIRQSFDLVRQKRIVPSMRSLQFGGKAIEAKNERIFNCSVRHVDSIRSFAEIFYLLLCGCGVGIGVTRKFLNRLPDLVTADNKTGTVLTYSVMDDTEGWADSVEALLSCYFRNTAFTGRKIVFDYSKIRRKGAKLKTSGGTAPGYSGLKQGHIKIKKLLDHIIEDKNQTRLEPINAYDILMHVADMVLSGGIRRSACITIFDKDDQDMLNSKTDNWEEENPQRARSNNSLTINRNTVTLEDFKYIIERTKQFGEPGFMFVDENDTDVLTNPCSEIKFKPITDDGICGVQFCNLTSINGSKIKSEQDFMECVEAATIIGTLQATYTEFPYLSPAAKKLTEEEALLGVSIIAIMENSKILLDPEIQKAGAKLAVKINKEWAKTLGINQAARVTCVKPDGNCSLTLGTQSSGIHPAHAHKMFRRIQMHEDDPILQFFKKNNPHVVEKSKWSANNTDEIVTFPITVPKKAITKNDLSAIEHLELIKVTQLNWVNAGTTSVNKKDITHSVSCTVSVKDDEWNEVTEYLYKNRKYFSAVSLISDGGDKIYKQSPREQVTELTQNKFDSMINKFKSVDYSELHENHDNTQLSREMSCTGGLCEIQ
jgi:ribonucleoside-diphosphate reductase alpha chain